MYWLCIYACIYSLEWAKKPNFQFLSNSRDSFLFTKCIVFISFSTLFFKLWCPCPCDAYGSLYAGCINFRLCYGFLWFKGDIIHISFFFAFKLVLGPWPLSCESLFSSQPFLKILSRYLNSLLFVYFFFVLSTNSV